MICADLINQIVDALFSKMLGRGLARFLRGAVDY